MNEDTMRIAIATVVLSMNLTGCGGSDDGDVVNDETPPAGEEEFPEAPEGYTRIEAPTMPGLPPGSDTMYCQYVYGPLDHDVDILDVSGYQSEGGHHSVAYATDIDKPIGTSDPCTEEEGLVGAFLGGTGGEAGGAAAKLPEGVAFRVRAGQRIMLNTHFLNTTESTIDGRSVLDIKFAEVDPNRKVASLFSNVNLSFEIGPQSKASAVAECTMPHGMEVIMLANHMHDYGSHIWTELVRAESGQADMIKEDPEWTYEMQFNVPMRSWSPEDPLVLQEGDTLRTHCNWNNTSDQTVAFPREMCVGVAFFLTDKSISPTCINGAYSEGT